MLGSSVLPDLLATMTSVWSSFTLSSNAFTCAGSVESSTRSSGKPACRPNVSREHLGAQAGAAHAEQERVAETRFLISSWSDLSRGARRCRRAEPAEPLGLVRARPHRRVLRPEPLDLVLLLPRAERGLHLGLRRRGELERLGGPPSPSTPPHSPPWCFSPTALISFAKDSSKSLTPSFTSSSVTPSSRATRARGPSSPLARPPRPPRGSRGPCRGRGTRRWSRAAWC